MIVIRIFALYGALSSRLYGRDLGTDQGSLFSMYRPLNDITNPCTANALVLGMFRD
jgi:hypothetical protein